MNICLFDIDGTLIASGGAGKAALESALAEEFGVRLRPGNVEFSGRTDRAIIRDLFRVHEMAEVPEHLQRLLDAYLERLPQCLAAHRGRILPGMAELLATLQARGDVVLGLLTGNVREGARLKLGHYQLDHYFTLGGFGDAHFERDDVAREAFAAVQQHRGGSVRGEDIWVIGDTPLDVQCARAIGARVAAVATGWHPFEELEATRPDLLLQDFADPGPFLTQLR